MTGGVPQFCIVERPYSIVCLIERIHYFRRTSARNGVTDNRFAVPKSLKISKIYRVYTLWKIQWAMPRERLVPFRFSEAWLRFIGELMTATGIHTRVGLIKHALVRLASDYGVKVPKKSGK
jgi:hypothetical protein